MTGNLLYSRFVLSPSIESVGPGENIVLCEFVLPFLNMSGCLDRVQCSCEWLEPVKEWFRPKRNLLASIVAGTLVSMYLHNLFRTKGTYNMEPSLI